ncbi:MAG: transposase [Candidatus Hydrogenedentes bacterium]|nr:transposase [Candidatus Hydrogenedentota bacterium]
MPQSLAKIYVHIIFSTKNRAQFLADEEFRNHAHAYLAGIFNANDSPALVVGGVADHVHALCLLSKTEKLADLIGMVKRSSSKWLKTQDGNLGEFAWQNGYGAFSVSYSSVTRVRNYILNQETHHAKVSFQDEFRKFLKRHAVEYDERYVWD